MPSGSWSNKLLSLAQFGVSEPLLSQNDIFIDAIAFSGLSSLVLLCQVDFAQNDNFCMLHRALLAQ